MSAETLAYVWGLKGASGEERLALLWLANAGGGFGYPVMPEYISLSEFMGCHFEHAYDVLHELEKKNLVRWGTEEEETSSYVWIVYDGLLFPPINWTQETTRRSSRVAALIERDGPECAYCGCTPVNYHVDHFIPRAKGGADKMANLVLSCPPCNLAKKDKLPEDFLRDDPKRLHTIITNLKYLHDGL